MSSWNEIFFVFLAMGQSKMLFKRNRRCFLQKMCNLEFWPPACGSDLGVSSCKFLFFYLVEVMVNLIGCKLVSLLASFLVSHLYFCVQTSSPNESVSYYWNLRRSGHLSQSAWAAASVPRTFKKNVFISFPSFCLGLWVIKCRPDTFKVFWYICMITLSLSWKWKYWDF